MPVINQENDPLGLLQPSKEEEVRPFDPLGLLKKKVDGKDGGKEKKPAGTPPTQSKSQSQLPKEGEKPSWQTSALNPVTAVTKAVEEKKKQPYQFVSPATVVNVDNVKKYEQAQQEYSAADKKKASISARDEHSIYSPIPLLQDIAGAIVPGYNEERLSNNQFELKNADVELQKTRKTALASQDYIKTEIPKILSPISDTWKDYITYTQDGVPRINEYKIREFANAKSKEYGVEEDGMFYNLVKRETSNLVSQKLIQPEVDKQLKTNFKKLYGKDLDVVLKDEKNQAALKAEELKTNAKTSIEKLYTQISAKAKEDVSVLSTDIMSQINLMNNEMKTLSEGINQKFSPLIKDKKFIGTPEQYKEYEQSFTALQQKEQENKEVFAQLNKKYLDIQNVTFTKATARAKREAEEIGKIAQAQYVKTSPGNTKLQKDIEKLYAQSYNEVLNKNQQIRKTLSYKNSPIVNVSESILSALGNQIKGWGAMAGSESMITFGEDLKETFGQNIVEFKSAKDYLEFDELLKYGSTQLGNMIPGAIGATAVTAGVAATGGAGASVGMQLVSGMLTQWAAETMSTAGNMYSSTLERTGDVAAANNAERQTVQFQKDILPLYAFSGLPFIGKGITKIIGKVAPQAVRATSPTIAKIAGFAEKKWVAPLIAGSAELNEEMLQEYSQNLSEEAITKEGSYANMWEYHTDEKFKNTFLNVAPFAAFGAIGELTGQSEADKKQYAIQQAAKSFALKTNFASLAPGQKEQFLFDVIQRQGAPFAAAYLTSAYGSGQMDKATFESLQQTYAKQIELLGKTEELGLTPVQAKLYNAFSTYHENEKKRFEETEDPIMKSIAAARMVEYESALTSIGLKREPNYSVVVYPDNTQMVFMHSELDNALNQPAFAEAVANGDIKVAVFGESEKLNTKIEESKKAVVATKKEEQRVAKEQEANTRKEIETTFNVEIQDNLEGMGVEVRGLGTEEQTQQAKQALREAGINLREDDTENVTGLPGQVGEGQTVVQDQSQQGAGAETTSTGGVLQTQGVSGQVQGAGQQKLAPVSVSNKTELAGLEQRTQSDKNKSAVLESAKKAIATLKSVFPDMDIFIHEDAESFNQAMKQLDGEQNSRGNFAFGRDENKNPTGTGRIDINLSNASETTVAHEVTHAVLLKAFGDSPATFKQFRDRISPILKADLNDELLAFEKMYEGLAVAPEEYLTQLSAMLANGAENVEYKPSTLRKIAAVINEFVAKITGGKFQPFKGEVDFKNFVEFLNQMAGAIREGNPIEELNTQQAYSEGRAFQAPANFKATKSKSETTSKSQIGDYQFPNDIDILKISNLPIKTLQDVVKKYNGRVVIITSDATGYGVDSMGQPILGGAGFASNEANVNDGIGFASLNEGTVKGTYTRAENAYGLGKAVVLIMVQPPHTTINNSYGARYMIRGLLKIGDSNLAELQKTKNSIKNFVVNSKAVQKEFKAEAKKARDAEEAKKAEAEINELKKLKEKGEVLSKEQENEIKKYDKKINKKKAEGKVEEVVKQRATQKALFELLDKIQPGANLDSLIKEFIDNTTFTLRKEIGLGIMPSTKETKTGKGTTYSKIAFNNIDYSIYNFLKEYGDNTILTEDMMLNNKGGVLVGGFEIDVTEAAQREKLIKDIQSKGILHPLFNAKLPGTNHFRLDGLYGAQENFGKYAVPDKVIDKNKITDKDLNALVIETFTSNSDYDAEYRSIPLEKRTYTHLKIANKTKLKNELLAPKGFLKDQEADVATKVAKGEGFIPIEGAAEEMAKATYVSKSQKDKVDKAVEYKKESGTTQVATTTGSYEKAAKLLKSMGIEGNVLDYGAGLGLGSDAMSNVFGFDVDSFEPNSERWKGRKNVTFKSSNDINKKYNSIVSLNVLNVVEKDIRDSIVKDIFNNLNDGGVAAISTRKWNGDVNQAKNAVSGGEKNSLYITRTQNGKEVKVFQKGFDGNELVDYITDILGDKVTVEKNNSFGASGVIIKKKGGLKSKSQLPQQKEGIGEEGTTMVNKSQKVYDETGFISVPSMIGIVKNNNPTYLGGVMEHIQDMGEKLRTGKVNSKDVAKSYLMAVSSIRSGDIGVAKFEDSVGKKVDEVFLEPNNKIRTEGAMAFLLTTEEGKRLLNNIESGKIDEKDRAFISASMKPFGMFGENESKYENIFGKPSDKQINLTNINEFNSLLKGGVKNETELFDAIVKLKGISQAKVGFVSNFLGIGTRGVIDAREIQGWLRGSVFQGERTAQEAEMEKQLTKSNKSLSPLQQEILNRMRAVGQAFNIDPLLAEYIGHHMIWDAVANEKTTHDGLYLAMTQNEADFNNKLSNIKSKSQKAKLNFGEGQEGKDNKKAFDKLTSTMPNSGEVTKYLSGETIEKYEGEVPRNKQDVLAQQLRPALERGVDIIEKAKELFGDKYVESLLQYVEKENLPPANKALIYVSLENEVAKQKLENPSEAAKIEKMQDLVRAKSQAFLRSNSLAINMGRLRRFAEVGYDVNKLTDRFFSSREIEDKKKIEDAVQATADDINKEAERIITDEENIKAKVDEGVREEIQKIYDNLSTDKKKTVDKRLSVLDKIKQNIFNKYTFKSKPQLSEGSVKSKSSINDIIEDGYNKIFNAMKAGVDINKAIEIGIDYIKAETEKSTGVKWKDEADFRNDITQEFTSQGLIDTKTPTKAKTPVDRLKLAKQKVRAQIESLKQQIADKERTKQKDKLKPDAELEALIKQKNALTSLLDKYVPKVDAYADEKNAKAAKAKLENEILELNRQIQKGQKDKFEKKESKENSELDNLRAEKEARQAILEALDPTPRLFIENALIEQGFGRQINVKTKNGIEQRDILDWKKLAGEEGSVDNIRERVEAALRDKGYTEEQILRMQDAFVEEYINLSESIAEKALNEINERNKQATTPEQKSAVRKLVEMYNYGLFDKDPNAYETALAKTVGLTGLSLQNFERVKELGEALSNLFNSNFEGKPLNESQLRSAIQVIEEKMRIILSSEAMQQGNGWLKSTEIAKQYMDASQRMMLNTVKQGMENPISGLLERFYSSIGYAGAIPEQLSAQQRKMARDIYKEMVLQKGLGYGNVGNAFINKGSLDAYIHNMSDSELVQGIMSVAMGKTILDAVDSAYKSKITQQKFTYNLIKILTQDRLVNGKLEKGMTKEEAKRYVAEKISGQSFEDAKETAKNIIEKINTQAGKKIFNDSPEFVSRLATDIVNAALVNGEKITEEMVTIAYNAAYKAAGRGLGHVANNWISRQINTYSGKLESEISEAIKQKKFNKAGWLNLFSIFYRNIANPFVGGGTNWIVLKAEKTGLGLISGLISRSSRETKMDLMTETGMKELEDAMYNSMLIKDKFIRGAVGGAVTALVFMLIKATGADDEYEKWIKKNQWAKKYLNVLTPEIMLAMLAAKESSSYKKYLESSFNKNEAFDKGAMAIKAATYLSAGEKEKAAGQAGQLMGASIGTPIPWRLVRDGQQIWVGATGGEPYAINPVSPNTFMEGYLKGGFVDYLGYAPISEDKSTIVDKEMFDSPEYKVYKDKEIKMPKLRSKDSYDIPEEIRKDKKMTDEEFDKFSKSVKEYELNGWIEVDDIGREKEYYGLKKILTEEWRIKEKGMIAEYFLGKDLSKEDLQNKVNQLHKDAVEKAKKDLGLAADEKPRRTVTNQ